MNNLYKFLDMKSLIKNLGILLLTLMSVTATAQDEVQRSYFPPRDAGWWTLGINGGWAYQSSDVPLTLDGYGFGMTLAKNKYYRPGGALSFDWRGRWLYSQTIGLDTKRATGLENNSALNGSREAGEGLDYTLPAGPGYTFQNHKTHQFELGLEGVITANRLRERTGVIASLYGGLNADWYGVKLDQSNNNGIYDYSGIDHINDSESAIRSQLKNIRDGVYETNGPGNEEGAGNIKIMPSLGAELGFQFTPRFSMHAGHKVTFARTDDLDGELWTNNNNLTGGNDIHHYTNLGLRWIIDPAKNELEPPIINVTNPGTNPYVSRSSAGRVDAKIKNVRNKIDVTCSVNGRPSSFSYNREKFRVNFPLEYGENQVVITASNEVGTDEEIVIIYYGDGISDPPVGGTDYSPRVRITSPSNSPYTTDQEDYTVRANIQYIQNSRDIEFFLNGRNVYDFNYNSRNDQFSGGIRLKEGRNEIEIIARNEVGSDRDNVVIFYERKVERPRVRITSPSRSPYETTSRDFTVRAELDNVDSKNDVRLFVNGREKSLFDYNSRTGRFTADLILERGRNDIVVRGRNEAGEAEDRAAVIYQEDNTPTARPPVVEITSPSRSTYETTQNSITIRAQLQYVDRKNDVRFFVNGQERSLFSYTPSTGRFSADINLVEGRNEVEIRGYNQVGNDRDEVTIIYTDDTPTGQPPVVTITSVSSGTSNPFEPNTNACRTTILADVLRVSRKSDITFRINGKKRTDFTFNSSTNEFRSTVTLEEGQNNISIRAVNSFGSDEDTASKNCTIATNPEPPQVTIIKPVDNSTTTSATTNLNARVKNVTRKNDIRVKLNGSTISNFSFSPVSGVVTTQLTLKEGYNSISVWARNNDGEDEAGIRIRYNAPSNPPEVYISKPVDNSSTTNANASASLSATVKNVSRKNDVRVKLNGSTINNFSLSSGKVTAQLTLKKGWNTISVWARNNDGEDEASVRVRFNPPVIPPTVDITQPANNTTTDTKVAVVKAKIMNVNGKGDIRFTFNGNNFSNFSYSNSSKTLTANVTLKEGNNTIVIKATTADGSDSESVRVKYVAPKILPTVKITTPRNNTSTDKKSISVKANLQNVASKSDVTFLVNGRKVNTFNYQRGTFNANVALTKGKNTLSIQAKNKDGMDTDQVIVTFVPKVVIAKPTIKFTTPSRPGAVAKKKKTTARATVKNIATNSIVTSILFWIN